MGKIRVLLLIGVFLSGFSSHNAAARGSVDLINNSILFPMAFTQYSDFLNENTVISGTAEDEMIKRVGGRIAQAAEKLLASEGKPGSLNEYKWEFTLVKDNAVNAWAMPGGKVVIYSGILPVAETEAGLAVVMGHEIAHAVLNHGLKRLSAEVLQQIGALGLNILTADQSPQARALIMMAYGVGSTMAGTLPYGREHENEADRYGLILTAAAGYNPDEGAAFWERMEAATGGYKTPELLSTHPSDKNRIKNLKNYSSEAKKRAAALGVNF